MDWNKLADALIKDENVKPLEEYEKQYPERTLEKGAQVTRLAPSPTGFMHIGNLYVALANERIAHQSGGVFYLRIEDTDEKRKVEGAVDVIHKSLKYFGVKFDEGADLCGEYGPYYQRQRAEIYHAYAKELIRQGLAYPCFCTEEDLEKIREHQTENKLLPGYYGEFAKCRDLTEEEIYANLAAGKKYVIRLRSQGDVNVKHTFRDEVKGEITVTENNQDVVILKSDGIPTYHFAHAIDDHFMRTTLVIRGEEWLSSLPIHIELFKVLGFRLPKYGHNCSIQKIDGETRRKLSKRKDPEASLNYYREQGYHPEAVRTYMMTLLNSNFEEWLLKNPETPLDEFKYSIGKMGKSGALFDIVKLNDISKTYMAKLDEKEMYLFLKEWADEFGTDTQKGYFTAPIDFEHILNGVGEEFVQENAKREEYLCKVLALCMGVGGKKRRKDFVCAKQAVEMISYFFDESFAPVYEYRFVKGTVRKVLQGFAEIYDEQDDNSAWFDKVKKVAGDNGFATDMKAYKANPEAYPGNVSDVAEMLRIATTGLSNTPDLWTIMQILGKERTLARLNAAINAL
ncbi:MAG: glutamate--tRNA ligase [Clostridia bacterium]|nr:glutamate--tRNA ligase [Clostridia bacterium]